MNLYLADFVGSIVTFIWNVEKYLILRFCYTSDAEPLLLKVWALQVEPAGAQKSRLKKSREQKWHQKWSPKGLWRPKVATESPRASKKRAQKDYHLAIEVITGTSLAHVLEAR